ncbi:RNA polymerase sigma factor [Zobellia sp. 1_MG-2023]|uniref:RNA polymerase sigma factor n=1 Tax=Zobellia sp. 1_MG-2023 TaxID=3062626 RepID=UPI0026E3A019|nr:sigma-70 family RNA polymerase sigma factor [Zobellia sp. 1_MG-2023]MDO6821273.1 sigma-70 family RNA polymerase sigma factor [Zobellia sp. 1_MG-2023]
MENIQAEITLEDLRKGSDILLKKVYESNRTKFLNYARRYNLSEEENIDVYQDAYIIFYDNVMSGKLESLTSSISTYLFSIGKYLIFDKMRKNKKMVSGDYDLSRVEETDEQVNTFDLKRPDLSEEQVLLKKHFSTLGEKCQQLLTLFYYWGYTIKEIMEAENYNNENVVKAAKSRCMKTLREKIQANTY